jgi:hypothetical protein
MQREKKKEQEFTCSLFLFNDREVDLNPENYYVRSGYEARATGT